MAVFYSYVLELTDDVTHRRINARDRGETNEPLPPPFHLPPGSLIISGRLDGSWEFIKCVSTDDSPVWHLDEIDWVIRQTHARSPARESVTNAERTGTRSGDGLRCRHDRMSLRPNNAGLPWPPGAKRGATLMATQLTDVIRFVADMPTATTFFRDTLGLTLHFQSPGWTEFETGVTTLALNPETAQSPNHARFAARRRWHRSRRCHSHAPCHGRFRTRPLPLIVSARRRWLAWIGCMQTKAVREPLAILRTIAVLGHTLGMVLLRPKPQRPGSAHEIVENDPMFGVARYR